MARPIRVWIADDHAIVREGLKQIVLADPHIAVAGECATGRDAVERVRNEDFDVLVLDLSFPDVSGFDVLARAKAIKPDLPVLILSMEREEEFALRCLRAGASGYLEKRTAPAELVTAIRRLAQGKRYVSTELAERLATEPNLPPARPHDLLTRREFEIFLAVAGGKSVRTIAAELGLSAKTVSNHRTHILEKLGLKSTSDLVRYAIRQELIH